jgi:hypothetical protein
MTSSAGRRAILATVARLKPPWLPAASHRTDQGGSRFLRHRLLVLLERPQHRRCGLLDAIEGRLDAGGRFVTATGPGCEDLK